MTDDNVKRDSAKAAKAKAAKAKAHKERREGLDKALGGKPSPKGVVRR